MDDYETIAADLMRLERWRYVAFAAACAERVALIFCSFGSPESVALYKQGLELAWLGVTQEGVASRAEQIANKIGVPIEGQARVTCQSGLGGLRYLYDATKTQIGH